MKIAHLVSSGDVAGGQVVALQLARAARDAGHDAVFVSPTAGAFVDAARDEGFAVDVVALGGALDVRSLVALRGLLRRRRIDILHSHVHFSLNVLARVAGRLAGARVVAHMHIENVFRTGRSRHAQVALDNLTARLCAAIIAVSESTRRSLVRQGYPTGRIRVVHNGVAPTAASPVRPAGVADDRTIVLHVGRLAPVKGQRELIDAMARLSHPDAVAVMVGEDLEADGSFGAELKRRALTAGVADRVVLAGYRDDVPALLAGCDVFVLPSYVEGFPLVVLEAMAAAKPVVATRAGGTPELVEDGVTGMLVDPGDVEALARAIDAVIADPARCRRLGEAGRRRIEERFSLQTMTARVLEAYVDS